MKSIKSPILVTVAMLCFTMFLSPVFAQDLSDAEIASVAVVANQIDIDYANIALKKTKDKEVLKFANAMIADHQAVIDMAVELVTRVTRLKVTPKDNAVSKQYLENAAQTKKMLESKSGKAFNKAYVDNEVAYHKAVIAAVKTVLIPQSDNAELKALLQKAVPILETHLHHAEMVQKEMQ